jgi:TM2 domain-containing membrane protein YozV
VRCAQCGNEVSPTASFCMVCGASQASSSPAPTGQLVSVNSLAASAPYGIEPTTGLPYSHRSKVAAGLLQIFLGGFGVGRFYTGHTGMAIAQIAVTFVTCGLGALWPLIDGIIMLAGNPRDADGRPMRG